VTPVTLPGADHVSSTALPPATESTLYQHQHPAYVISHNHPKQTLPVFFHQGRYGDSSHAMYTSPTKTVHPTVMAIAIIGRFALAKSSLRIFMCFFARISCHKRLRDGEGADVCWFSCAGRRGHAWGDGLVKRCKFFM